MLSDIMVTEQQKQNFGIVGGGMLGLTLAWELAKQGHQVTLFESSNSLGGLASAWQLETNDGQRMVWDRHYHVTLLSDTWTRYILTELGLEQEMQWVETRTGVYADGKLYSVSNAAEFLQFPPLRLIDKLRLGGTIFYASRLRDWKKLEAVSVADWLSRLSGRRTFEKFWLPLLRAKLGENYQHASAAFIWTTIARLYAARRTGLKKEMFGYLPGGYGRLLETFAAALERKGVQLRLGHKAERIVATAENSIEVIFSNGQRETFENVLVTAPTHVAARLCEGLNRDEISRLNGVKYQGIICASLVLKKSLANYYVTNLTDDWVPFTGVIEMSALVDRKEFGGNALVYLPKYLAADDPAWQQTDEHLKEIFVSALERMYSHFRREDVLAFQVSRVRYVFPIPTLNYSERVPGMKTSVPGLSLVNSAQILNGTLNVNETVQLAVKSAAKLMQESEAGKAALADRTEQSKAEQNENAAVKASSEFVARP
jgi:protoporphyrinogen oxidase